MSISDPLSSGLLFRRRRRHPSVQPSTTPPSSLHVPSLLQTPPSHQHASSLLSSHPPSVAPPSSLKELVERNEQPLAVRAAAAALRAAQLEHTRGRDAAPSALRAASRVVSHEQQQIHTGATPQSEVRRLFHGELNEQDDVITQPIPLAHGRVDDVVEQDDEFHFTDMPHSSPQMHASAHVPQPQDDEYIEQQHAPYNQPPSTVHPSLHHTPIAEDPNLLNDDLLFPADSNPPSNRRRLRHHNPEALPTLEPLPAQANSHTNVPSPHPPRTISPTFTSPRCSPRRHRTFVSPQHPHHPTDDQRQSRQQNPFLSHTPPTTSPRRHVHAKTTQPSLAQRAEPSVKKEPREEAARRASAPAVGRVAKRKGRPRLSEVLRLQKSLETAQWTNSRAVSSQTEVIVISDDEAPSATAGAVATRRKTVKEGKMSSVEEAKDHKKKGLVQRVLRAAKKKEDDNARAEDQVDAEHAVDSVSRKAAPSVQRNPSADPKNVEARGKVQSKEMEREASSGRKSTSRVAASVEEKQVKVQKKRRWEASVGDASRKTVVAGQKSKSSSSDENNQRVRLTEHDRSAMNRSKGTYNSSKASRRVSPRRISVSTPTEIVEKVGGTRKVSKRSKASRASEGGVGKQRGSLVPDAVRKERKDTGDTKEGLLAAPNVLMSPPRRSARHGAASSKDDPQGIGHVGQKKSRKLEADMAIESPVKRRRKAKPSKHTESSSDVLAESRENRKKFDEAVACHNGRKTVPSKRQALKRGKGAFKDWGASDGDVMDGKIGLNERDEPLRTTRRKPSNVVVRRKKNRAMASSAERDVMERERQGGRANNNDDCMGVQPAPRRQGKERKRIQPIQMEIDELISERENRSDQWRTAAREQRTENRNSIARKNFATQVPKLRSASRRGTLSYARRRRSESSSKEHPEAAPVDDDLEDCSDDEYEYWEKLSTKEWSAIAHGWRVECKVRRHGLSMLAARDMLGFLRGPFGLGINADEIVSELDAPVAATGRNRCLDTDDRSKQSDAERTHSSGLSDEDINLRQESSSQCLLE